MLLETLRKQSKLTKQYLIFKAKHDLKKYCV